ncbi:MAG: hypothetical protein ACREJ5_04415 [Geminicoccaceae bacterium]
MDTAQLHALIEAERVAADALRVPHDGYAESERRFVEAYRAVLVARPTEPRGIAAWLRWLGDSERDITGMDHDHVHEMLEHVARQFEAMAPPA